MASIDEELGEIGRLLGQARLIGAVRREVRRAVRDKNVVVAEGRSMGHRRCQVIIAGLDGDDVAVVARRLRGKISDVEIEEMVDGVIGVRTSRRGNRGG